MASDEVAKAAEPTPAAASAPEPELAPAPVSASEPAPVSEPAASGVLPSQHWAETGMPEPLGDNGSETDADSTFGDGQSETDSMASSILKYRTILGRTYHGERGNAQYWVTNEEQSNEALDINHHVMNLILDGQLFKAPLQDDIKEVVDIGTGTGIWAIDFADQFPDANVIGTDLSPIQPSWVPPNLQFQIDDCTQPWTFKENSLDYVHMRFLVGSIVDWDALYAQAYRALKPGGWIESHEASPVIRSDDGTVKDKSAMQQWGPIFLKGGAAIGRSFAVLEDNLQRKGMEAAGFTDIHESNHKVPIGGWPQDPTLREAGRFFQAAITNDIEGTLGFIASVHGWTKEEVTVFGAHYRSEIRDKRIHAYFSQRVVWAQKPLA